jgi:hypothetical protein
VRANGATATEPATVHSGGMTGKPVNRHGETAMRPAIFYYLAQTRATDRHRHNPDGSARSSARS